MIRKGYHVFATPNMLHILYRYAVSIDVSPEPLFESTGLSLEALRNAGIEARISIEQYNALWNAIAARAGDSDFGLHLGEAAHDFLGGDVLSTVMLNCSTVGDALEKFARYHDLATNAVQLRVTRRGAHAHLTWRPYTPDLVLDRHHWEAVVSGVALRLRDLTEQPVRCVDAHFSHARPANIAEHRRIFRCPVRFAQPDVALVIPGAALSRPIFLANPALLTQIEEFAETQLEKLRPPDTWTSKVARRIKELLWRGEKPTLEAVAHELAVSVRYVQKQLKAEGTTYRTLRDELREDIALTYLRKPDVLLTDVAFLLGFSEQSAFTHAFKRWTGMSPQQYRELKLSPYP